MHVLTRYTLFLGQIMILPTQVISVTFVASMLISTSIMISTYFFFWAEEQIRQFLPLTEYPIHFLAFTPIKDACPKLQNSLIWSNLQASVKLLLFFVCLASDSKSCILICIYKCLPSVLNGDIIHVPVSLLWASKLTITLVSLQWKKG